MKSVDYSAQALTLVLAVMLTGCVTPKYVINSPPAPPATVMCTDPASVSCSVPLNVAWAGVSVHPFPDSTTLDGAAISPNWSTSTKSVQASITAPVGNHTVTVSGLLSDGASIQSYSASTT